MSAANHIALVTPKCAARRRIAGMGTSPAVLTNAVWALAHRTGDDNLRAADFMLAQLRQYTEDSGTELHVSIAGGRKTMSALLSSCMTLLGREQDKVYHVLLPPEFEQGVEPPLVLGVSERCVSFVDSGTGTIVELFNSSTFQLSRTTTAPVRRDAAAERIENMVKCAIC